MNGATDEGNQIMLGVYQKMTKKFVQMQIQM